MIHCVNLLGLRFAAQGFERQVAAILTVKLLRGHRMTGLVNAASQRASLVNGRNGPTLPDSRGRHCA